MCNRCSGGCDSCNCTCQEPCLTPDCACKVFITTDCVTLSEDLTCSNILKGQTETEVLKQLDTYICERFTSVENFLKIINVGTGIGVYKGVSVLGKKELKTLVDSNLINIVAGTDTITISVDETVLNTFIEANQKTYSVLNTGVGAEIYKNNTVTGDNTQLNLRKIKSSDNSVTIVQGIDDINITSNGESTKVTAGTGISVTGIGTTPSPYVINSTLNGSETKLTGGTNISIIGSGTIGVPYVINSTLDGSETKITNGTNTVISGSGTLGSPYQIAVDGTETKVTAGTSITVTGNGSAGIPYVINAGSNAGSNTINSGWFSGLEVAFSTGALTVSGGGITAAFASVSGSSDSIVLVTMGTAMPNLNYYVRSFIESQGANINDDNDIPTPAFRPVSTTQFRIAFRETAPNIQNLKIHLEVTKY